MKRVKEIATALTGVVENRKFMQGVRADGFTVFLDKVQADDEDADMLRWLNEFRVQGRPADVIMAVGMVRYIQIVRNYARKYQPSALPSLEKSLAALVGGKAKYKKIRGKK